ncbi:helix-turn-helix domain-containing protein [Clostridium sp. NSJ-49]|nr:helix-turn-helix domain-containing protein [Clostridium sp. NSJ-49]MBC5627035.1 helix-turn-helix domain-containing protein [Clostridium sp. NSJ-49]
MARSLLIRIKVYSHISKIRRKLGLTFIKSVPGMGIG